MSTEQHVNSSFSIRDFRIQLMIYITSTLTHASRTDIVSFLFLFDLLHVFAILYLAQLAAYFSMESVVSSV
jgi:hypothetical protein